MSDDDIPDRSALIERFLIGLGMLALAVAIVFFSCRASGQEGPTISVEPPMTFPPLTNTPSPVIERRAAQPMVPALPPPKQRVITRTTNSEQEIITVILEKPAQPPPLVQDRPKTNGFWVSCPECKVRAIRRPKHIEVVGAKAVPGGDEIERWLYFRCCNQDFRRRNFKFVEEELAIEVPTP